MTCIFTQMMVLQGPLLVPCWQGRGSLTHAPIAIGTSSPSCRLCAVADLQARLRTTTEMGMMSVNGDQTSQLLSPAPLPL